MTDIPAAIRGVTPKLAERLAEGHATVTAWVTQDMMAGFSFARLPFHAIAFDLQHSRHGAAAVMHAIPGVVAAGKPVVVRLPVGETTLASQLLDAGASCIIAPMISSVQDARRLVQACKYAPLGERSWGPFDAVHFSGLTRQAYLETANQFSLALAMIETREGLANLDGILGVEGLDGVFIGRADLAVSLSEGRQVDGHMKEVDEALAHIVARCRAVSKIAGLYCPSGESANAAVAAGFRFVALGSDVLCMTSGAQSMLDAAGPAFE